MNIPKQFMNVIGAILVLAVLTAGVLLLALPLFGQSTATATEADLVAQTNVGYETQIVSLRERESDMDEIQQTVAELRREIPDEPMLDDVFEVIAAAATSTGVDILTITVGETTAWTPREPLTPQSVLSTDGTATEGTTAETPEATGDAAVDGTTEGATTDGSGTTDVSAAGPQVQVAFTITVDAPSPAQAEQFVDALGEGTRLVGIVHTALTPGAESYDLTVNALAFVRTEN